MGGVVDAVGGFVSNIFGGGSDSGDAQAAGLQANAAATAEAAKIQQQTAREYLDFQKQQYADLKPLAEQISKAQISSMQQQDAISRSNEARAQEYADYEKTTYRPLEKGIVADAQSFDTEAKREELARKGMADVSQAYDAQRKQALDTLARYGINPNSNRFAAINSQLALSEAGAKAGAATDARSNAEQLGYARKLDAASLGRNLAANSSTAYGIATNASNSSVNAGSTALNTASAPGTAMGNAYGSFSSQMGNAANSYYGSGNLYGQGYKIAAGADQAGAAGIGSIIGAYVGSSSGSAAITNGMKALADGGKVHRGKGAVRGPGGPVDDKIPAMLSNGEYVLPADTAAAIGKNKLDKLVKATHTPAATQRRQAIATRG